ncbi:MAG: bifunctional glutamate N-acetyltransferase/amino-acid acetyltransferase ArgJ [Actinobacteria bacterium]|nr:bifunctional glutamate N-acetyltransferase/amino-acid acetyltransferase ArgJ [Actinomycetota bacterium]
MENMDIIDDGTITDVTGFFAAGCHCGIKMSGKPDFCIIYTERDSTCSGVFTRNKYLAAPVAVTMEQISKGSHFRAIVVNSGIANACTGRQGYDNAKKTIELSGRYLKIDTGRILVSSTGVIGNQLPMEKVEKGVRSCSAGLSREGGHKAAEAILTTDLVKKEIAVKAASMEGSYMTVGGIAKGSGMIEPNMATMLAFIGTDVHITKELLHSALKEEIAFSFNSITVDGCESTNDMVLVMANGAGGVIIKNKDENYRTFKKLMGFVLKDLAKKIVMDAEGATKFIEIEVANAKNNIQAKKLAKSVANSNLFKAAAFGKDLNWGRINAAIGSAEGCEFEPYMVDVYLNKELIVKNGIGTDISKEKAKKIMEPEHLKFLMDFNNGKGHSVVWTSDLSLDYVKINALYRT